MCIERHVQIYGDNSSDSTSWLNPRKNGRKNALITPFGQVDAPNDWDTLESLSFNINQLVRLEDSEHQQLEMLVPPKLPRPVQMQMAI